MRYSPNYINKIVKKLINEIDDMEDVNDKDKAIGSEPFVDVKKPEIDYNEIKMNLIIDGFVGDLDQFIKDYEADIDTSKLNEKEYYMGLLSFIENMGNSESKIYEDIYGSVEIMNILTEAEYKGRKVQLGKIMQGDVKKFKVFVKNDKGKVVKVNFGFGGKSAKGKRMVIKKNNPERRRSFRARHNCDNPGPRWKPRYWACRTW
jgi:hypothetical protein